MFWSVFHIWDICLRSFYAPQSTPDERNASMEIFQSSDANLTYRWYKCHPYPCISDLFSLLENNLHRCHSVAYSGLLQSCKCHICHSGKISLTDHPHTRCIYDRNSDRIWGYSWRIGQKQAVLCHILCILFLWLQTYRISDPILTHHGIFGNNRKLSTWNISYSNLFCNVHNHVS